MRLLIDNNLPPSLVASLSGWDVVHAQKLGLQAAPDEVLFDLAAREKRILVSQDADFGTLLARFGAKAQFLIQLNAREHRKKFPESTAGALMYISKSTESPKKDVASDPGEPSV